MKFILFLFIICAPLRAVFAEFSLSAINDAWRACVNDRDCTVIHVNGCPWDSIPVAFRHTEEVREWAKKENMRHNCAREAVSDELKRRMRSHCVNSRCEFAPPLAE